MSVEIDQGVVARDEMGRPAYNVEGMFAIRVVAAHAADVQVFKNPPRRTDMKSFQDIELQEDRSGPRGAHGDRRIFPARSGHGNGFAGEMVGAGEKGYHVARSGLLDCTNELFRRSNQDGADGGLLLRLGLRTRPHHDRQSAPGTPPVQPRKKRIQALPHENDRRGAPVGKAFQVSTQKTRRHTSRLEEPAK